MTTKGNEVIRLIGGRSNVFLIRHKTGSMLIVDTGVRMSRSWLMKALKNHGAMKADYLILTHCHFDHVANAAFLREKTGAHVVIHKDEAGFLENGTMSIPAGTYPHTSALVKLANVVHVKLGAEPCTVDMEFDDSLILPGFEGIELIHTPGHSSGSISILVDNEIALVGDTMVNAPLFKIFPPFADDVTILMESWKRLLDTGCTTFLPSHGNAITRQDLLNTLEKKLK